MSLLPVEAPSIEGLDLAGYNAACHTVGGDYYDYLEFEGERIGLILGDVAGKGMPASLMMTGLQARVQVLADLEEDPAVQVAILDRHISVKCPQNRFITLFYCVVNARTGRVRYCNAGHNPTILLRADGSHEMLRSTGTVLGILPELGYETKEVTLSAGDTLLLYSDGVTEAVKSGTEIEFAEERLISTLRDNRELPAEEIIQKINDALLEWTQGDPPDDDITMLLAKKV
jgi:sigma-B regulation protein RsbU (phosphoserine phosphatase)